MSSVRVIKKYPNRRLYDTEDSRYITLSDIRDLVLGKVEFVVLDKKNGRDITRCVLLQVISEQEQQGDPAMSQAFLSEIIRYHSELTSASLSTYLEQSLSMYLTQHVRAAAGNSGGASEAAPVNFTRRKSRKSSQNEGQRRFPGSPDDADPVETQQIPSEQKKAS
jgi:polyhydroxyalkanoate synthesis repressor PhaR